MKRVNFFFILRSPSCAIFQPPQRALSWHLLRQMSGTLLRFKLGSAALTLTVATLGVALPWIFHRVLSERAFRLLSLGNMLSVGVMLSGGLLHLITGP